MEENLFSCKVCNKIYKNYKTLRQHVIKYHPNDVHLVRSRRELKSYEFTCNLCHRRFANKYSFRAHQRNMHNVGEKSRQCSTTLTCPLCNEILQRKDNISHLSEKHDIVVQTESLQFLSFEDFISWKNEMEKESYNVFITKTGPYMTEKRTTHYYMCHRSGDFVSKGTGLRHLKSKGSKKICGYCPAEIKATICNDTKKVSVEFVKTHVGHENEIKHVTLTDKERRQIGSKIAQQIPFDTILDEIRDSISGKGLERIHLLTKKDLHNISSSFNLNSNVACHKNKSTSVEAPNSPSINLQSKSKGIQSDKTLQELQENSEIQDPADGSNFEKEKEWVCQQFIEKATSIKTKEQVRIVKHMLKTLDAKLNATCSTNKRTFSKAFDNNIPHNQNKTPQDLFFSSRKKMKSNNRAIKKTTREESQNIALAVIVTKNNVDS